MDHQDLFDRLEPFAQGCFGGYVSDHPQLKPLLKDIYEYLKIDLDYPGPRSKKLGYSVGYVGCPTCGASITGRVPKTCGMCESPLLKRNTRRRDNGVVN